MQRHRFPEKRERRNVHSVVRDTDEARAEVGGAPWKASSTSAMVGVGLFLSNAYMDMTMPGVQKPHWEPWAFAIRSWNTTETDVVKRTRRGSTDVSNQAPSRCSVSGLAPSSGDKEQLQAPPCLPGQGGAF